MTAAATVLALSRRVITDLPGEPARRAHIAQTLAQLAGYSDQAPPISTAQLGCGYQVLCSLSTTDHGIRNLRSTCRELYMLCKSDGGAIDNYGARDALERCCRLWERWIDGVKDNEDPRLQAMCLTFRRELAELMVALVDATDNELARHELAKLGAG